VKREGGGVGLGLGWLGLICLAARSDSFLSGRVSPPSPRRLRTMEIRHHGPELASARPRSRWFISRFATRLSPRRLQVPESVGCRTLNRGVPAHARSRCFPAPLRNGRCRWARWCGSLLLLLLRRLLQMMVGGGGVRSPALV